MSAPYQRPNESDMDYRARYERVVGRPLACNTAICPCGSGLPVEDDGMCICCLFSSTATAPRTWHPYAMDIGYDPAFEAELDSRDDDNHCETCSDTGWTTDDGGATYSVCLHGWEDEG